MKCGVVSFKLFNVRSPSPVSGTCPGSASATRVVGSFTIDSV